MTAIPSNAHKKLIYRSWHRGTREMDMLLGRFAEENVPDFDPDQLAEFEAILQIPDPDLYDWVTGRKEPPANSGEILKLFLTFHQKS